MKRGASKASPDVIDFDQIGPPFTVRGAAEGMAVRTRHFDRMFTDAGAAGVRQAVILAAGLDARAYRLPWPDGTVVYEVDQPEVVEFKTRALGELGAKMDVVRNDAMDVDALARLQPERTQGVELVAGPGDRQATIAVGRGHRTGGLGHPGDRTQGAAQPQQPGDEAHDQTEEDRPDRIGDRHSEPGQDQAAIAPQKGEIPGVAGAGHCIEAPPAP